MSSSIAPNIAKRLAGASVVGLNYNDEGYVVISLDTGFELWVSADSQGYHLFVEPSKVTTAFQIPPQGL